MKVEGHINHAVIGAGPGGLMAGKTLGERDPGQTVVFEQGKRERSKYICPVLVHHKNCSGCQGACHIINGAGGACSDVSCGLLSKHPAGSGLAKYLPVETIKRREDEIISWLENIHGRPLDLVTPHVDQATIDSLQAKGIESKSYPSYEVMGTEFRALINQMVGWVHQLPNVDVRFSTRVNNITQDKGSGFLVDLSDGKRLHANHVIFAGGRAGKYESLDMWSQMGVDVNKMKGYVGIRVEGPVSPALVELRKQIADPKFTRDGERIFCFCPEGLVVGMRNNPKRGKFAGSFFDTLEGCVQPNTGFGNFSIQESAEFTLAQYEAFLEEMIAKQKELSGGNIVSQSLRSLVDGGPPESFPTSITNRVVTGKIADLLPAERILKSMEFLFDLDAAFNHGIIGKNTGVHSPELHVWPELNLGPGFESEKVKGVHVIGDVSGVARGIMQAMIMGAEAADHIVGKG